jgi:cell division protein FtsZ
VLLNAVQGISDLIQYHGYINVDFADVKTIMSDRGLALMGTGRAAGEKRALAAMQQAISSPLLEDVTIDGATGLLINITGGRDMTLQEINEALTLVHDAADPEAEIIFGSLIDETVQDEIKITLIATGFQHRDAKHRIPTVSAQAPAPPRQAQPTAPREEIVPLAVSKPGSRSAPMGEPKPMPSPRTSIRESSLSVDEDQFDIPTFLRRHGQSGPS